MNRALAENRVVCLLADRDISDNGIEVEFFGERDDRSRRTGAARAANRRGAAARARRTSPRAATRPASGPRSRPRARAGCGRTSSGSPAAVVRHMEDAIRERPEQWLLMQPNWPSDSAATGAQS